MPKGGGKAASSSSGSSATRKKHARKAAAKADKKKLDDVVDVDDEQSDEQQQEKPVDGVGGISKELLVPVVKEEEVESLDKHSDDEEQDTGDAGLVPQTDLDRSSQGDSSSSEDSDTNDVAGESLSVRESSEAGLSSTAALMRHGLPAATPNAGQNGHGDRRPTRSSQADTAQAAQSRHGGRKQQPRSKTSENTGAAAQKPQKKKSKKHKKGEAAPLPRKKQFIPPVKPTNTNIDPVDTFGLGYAGTRDVVPADWIVQLRLLHKSDEASIERGLNGIIDFLQSTTSASANEYGEDEQRLCQLRTQAILPVLTHHYARLFCHPFRAIRLATSAMMAAAVTLAEQESKSMDRVALLDYVTDSHIRFVAALLIAAFDGDRAVRAIAVQNWQRITALCPIHTLLPSLSRTLLQLFFASLGTSALQKASTEQSSLLENNKTSGDTQPPNDGSLSPDDAVGLLAAAGYLWRHHNVQSVDEMAAGILHSGGLRSLLSSTRCGSPNLRQAGWQFLQVYAGLISQRRSRMPRLDALAGQLFLLLFLEEPDFKTQRAAWPVVVDMADEMPDIWLEPVPLPTEHANGLSASHEGLEPAGDRDTSLQPAYSPTAGEFAKLLRSCHQPLKPIDRFLKAVQIGFNGHPTLAFAHLPRMIRSLPKSAIIGDGSNIERLFSSLWAPIRSRQLRNEPTAAFVAFVEAFCAIVCYCWSIAPSNNLLIEQVIAVVREYCTGSLLADANVRTSGVKGAYVQLSSLLRDLIRATGTDYSTTLQLTEGIATCSVAVFGQAKTSDELEPLTILLRRNEHSNLEMPGFSWHHLMQRLLLTYAGTTWMTDTAQLDFITMLLRQSSLHEPPIFESISEEHTAAFEGALIRDATTNITPLMVYLDLAAVDKSRAQYIMKQLLAQIQVDEAAKSNALLAQIAKQTTVPVELRLALQEHLSQQINTIFATPNSLTKFSQLPALFQGLPRVLDESSTHTIVARLADMMWQAVLEDMAATEAAAPRQAMRTMSEIVALLMALPTSMDSDLANSPALEAAVHLHLCNHRLPSATEFAQVSALQVRMMAQLATDQAAAQRTVNRAVMLFAEQTSSKKSLTLYQAAVSLLCISGQDRSDLLVEVLPAPDFVLDSADQLVHEDHVERSAAFAASRAVHLFDKLLPWLSHLGRFSQDRRQHHWIIWPLSVLRDATQTCIDDVAAAFEGATSSMGLVDWVLSCVLREHSRQINLDWHNGLIDCLKHGPPAKAGGSEVQIDPLQERLGSAWSRGRRSKQAVANVVARMLNAGSTEKLSLAWSNYMQTLQAKDEHGHGAICSAIAGHLDGTVVAKLVNETVSRLSAATEATPAISLRQDLHKLGSVLPYASSGLETPAFARRCILMLQALQRCINSDQPRDEPFQISTICCQILIVGASLLPVLQHSPGQHLLFLLDIGHVLLSTVGERTEAWLGDVSVAAHFADRLQHYMRQNTTLRQQCLEAHRALAAETWTVLLDMPKHPSALSTGSPAVANLASIIPRLDVPRGEEKVDELCRLFSLNDVQMQMCASTALRTLIPDYTADLVLKTTYSASDSEAQAVEIRLPPHLFANLRIGQQMQSQLHSKSFWLAWEICFLLFQDASQSVKAAYAEQLRRDGLFAEFFATLLQCLQIDAPGTTQKIDLSAWDLSSPLHDATSQQFQCVQAAKLYYLGLRSCPVLFRQAWTAIRDKQLNNTVSIYTSKYFSELLVGAEMDRLRSMISSLDSDVFSIRIMPNVNEVKATYLVDEQSMDISIAFPNDYPLSPVDVREGQRLGVSESVWRAWLLNLQTVITFQGNSVADALALFNSNADRHFAGVEACAICYSVISVTDRSMPNKKCRTCKNAFHPSCLFKWFSTSHSSSCPLCRQLF